MPAFFNAIPSHRGTLPGGRTFRIQRTGITLWLVWVCNADGVRQSRRVGSRQQVVDLLRNVRG